MRRTTVKRGRAVAVPGVIAFAIAAFGMSAPAAHAVTCPNPVPVVDENNCKGPGTTSWRLTSYNGNALAAFATETSVNRGADVVLKIARSGGMGFADIAVYRMGYYGGTGGRLVHSSNGVLVPTGSLNCNGTDATTGLTNCNNWADTYVIPASTLPASGVYLAKVRDTATNYQTHVVFVVRDDNRVPESRVLFTLPTATYQAYNSWTGKSLYDFSSNGAATITGSPRAAKVSFDRPYDNVFRNDNWFLKADYPLVFWLERQGYDVAYTENVAVHQNVAELREHDVLVLSGHDEYWSGEQLAGYKAARDAGVDLASFSANTAYWKVRYEDGGRTLVSYKTVQGAGGDGRLGANDWGPDGQEGTADDALGLDQRAGTADDRPENSTTTFRDNGAPPGDPTAPPEGRVGPDTPENALLGAMYVGDNVANNYPLTVPQANTDGEFAGDRIWRRTGISTTSQTAIGTDLVGWEWDAVPSQAQYLAHQPSGVKRLSETNTVDNSPSAPNWLQDEGRVYGSSPPPGQPPTTTAVKYAAASGAKVFHAGTNQWSWGLGPHFIQEPGFQTYLDAPTDSSDPRIQQATYNVISDAGVQPETPTGVSLDGNESPTAAFTISPNPAETGQTVVFDGSGSSDTDGQITRYEWDLDGDGSFETDTGTTATASRSYSTAATLAIRLRVTDDKNSTGEAVMTLTIGSGASGPYSESVLQTPGLKHYWRLGETEGTTFADSKGTSHATTAGEPSLGAAGALAGDSNGAVRFDGINDAASAPLDLATTSAVTVEFWLNWDAFANDDDLALEYTSNFNLSDGGFLIDPNAPEEGGKFGIGIGRDGSRNNAYFTRPSAGEWHHYAFVLDTTASADQQITPYVDGVAVPYTKTASGTGAGSFAASTLYFMSRSAASLFGAGGLDEVAIYDRVLDAATIRDHFQKGGGTTANEPPTASFTIAPNPAQPGEPVSFDGAGSNDPDGQITKYEWDLDGNGSFETNTGSTPTASRSYDQEGVHAIKLRVTDDQSTTAEAIESLTVGSGATSPYSAAVLDTAGLRHYWRLGETTGTTLADAKGGAHATTVGGPALGGPGAVQGDSDPSAFFDGVDDAAQAQLALAHTDKLTLEFWLRWDAYADDDDLALEYTPNFNQNDGGFIVDPNAPQQGGAFGVGIGRGGSRNNVFFNRPSAGQWHHYAFVIDTAAPAEQQITPYVDGVAVPYTKMDSGTGAGTFANSSVSFMSRNAAALFGKGDLDELAIYDTALPATTIQDHYQQATGTVPQASFTVSPNPAESGQQVNFDGSASTDADGQIVKYEWDLDGNGSFETDTGSTPSTTHAYATPGTVTARLRVTDDTGKAATASRTVTITNRGPTASFTATPDPAEPNQTVTFDGSGSSDPDGLITRYEWDLDGNGSFETDTGLASSASRSYATSDTIAVRLRVTDGESITDTAIRTLTIGTGAKSPYTGAVLGTSNLKHYWRLGERAGGTLADLQSGSHARLEGGQLGAPGALPGDDDTSIDFDGTDDFASAPVDLSGTSTITVEFWLKWNAFANDDDLAMELTPNFNLNDGGFLIDPNAPQRGGKFGVGIGREGSRNTAFFDRPSAGQWHHYAFVLDTTVPADQQITPYVDGVAVPYRKAHSGTGAGNFANSTLFLMARDQNLFGAGGMDEVAIYSGALGAAAIDDHYRRGLNQAPTASFTHSPESPVTGETVAFDASGSSDPEGQIAKYEWDLDGNGSFETDTGTSATASRSYSTAGTVTVGLRVSDDYGATGETTRTVTIGQNQSPSASFTISPNPVTRNRDVAFDASESTDPDGTIARYQWDLDGNGSFEVSSTDPVTVRRFSTIGIWTVTLRTTDNAGATANASNTFTVLL